MKKVIIITILAIIVGIGAWFEYTEARESDKEDVKYHSKFSEYSTDIEEQPADPQEILELVNKERARIGVAPLAMDENVQKSAQLKANDMEVKGYRQHIIPGTRYTLSNEMAYWINKSCSKSSENLIWRSDNGIETTGGAFDGWMGSEPHRKAIQNPKYTKTGIAVSPDKRIVVQHFCVP